MSSILRGLNEALDFDAMRAADEAQAADIRANPEKYAEKYNIPVGSKNFLGAVLQAITHEKHQAFSKVRPAPEKKPIDRAAVEKELARLSDLADPAYHYSDDHAYWTKQSELARKIVRLKQQLKTGYVSETFSPDKRLVGRGYAFRMPNEVLWTTAIKESSGQGAEANSLANWLRDYEDSLPKIEPGDDCILAMIAETGTGPAINVMYGPAVLVRYKPQSYILDTPESGTNEYFKNSQILVRDEAALKKLFTAIKLAFGGTIQSTRADLQEATVGQPAARDAVFNDFTAWKKAVSSAYPTVKMKFKGRVEGGVNTISAEVPGEDRSYGVWDQDKETGVVLAEARIR